MHKLYASVILVTLFSSCRTLVNYVGQTLPSTTNAVDVFVDARTISKSYSVIGKGYIDHYIRLNYKKMQWKAVNIAKEKGADAVLFQDYYVIDNDASLTTTFNSDSSRNFKASGSTNPVLDSRHQILFLKYK